VTIDRCVLSVRDECLEIHFKQGNRDLALDFLKEAVHQYKAVREMFFQREKKDPDVIDIYLCDCLDDYLFYTGKASEDY